MKCRVCKGPAAVEIRRHNAAFCRDHFLGHLRSQVDRTIRKFDMIGRDDRVLVAVSGGKDSLALWDLLLDLGYAADGLYIGLGIGEYSGESQRLAEGFAKSREATLRVVDMMDTYGYDIPIGARAARRATCGTCGLSKRHVMNDVARRHGYDVLATGHNLDDEAATLFGNVLHWNVDALARQRPVLPGTDGFTKKVKPLIRLGEREMAAYCVLRGIDYIVEECPMVGGNTGLRYKEALNGIEQASPGTKHQFFFGFLDRGAGRFRLPHSDDGPADRPDDVTVDAREDVPDLRPCAECGAPTTAEVCAFCRLRGLATDPERVEVALAREGRNRRRRRRR